MSLWAKPMLFVEALGRPVSVFHNRARRGRWRARSYLAPYPRDAGASPKMRSLGGELDGPYKARTRRSKEDAAMARHEAGGRPLMAILLADGT